MNGKLTQQYLTKKEYFLKTNMIIEPIMTYLTHKVTQQPVQTTKQIAQSNPKLMSAAQALAIEAAALIKKK